MNIEYEVLNADTVTVDDHACLCVLLKQLSPRMMLPSFSRLEFLARVHKIFVARDQGRVVAMATLVSIPKFSGDVGYVDYVVVNDSHRGLGIGKGIMVQVITFAKAADLMRLDLTTRPEREAANGLYERLGFQRRETNVYRLELAGH